MYDVYQAGYPRIQVPAHTHMTIDSLVEVLVLLNEELNVVVVWLVGWLKEGLSSQHPAFSLFAVAVE